MIQAIRKTTHTLITVLLLVGGFLTFSKGNVLGGVGIALVGIFLALQQRDTPVQKK